MRKARTLKIFHSQCQWVKLQASSQTLKPLGQRSEIWIANNQAACWNLPYWRIRTTGNGSVEDSCQVPESWRNHLLWEPKWTTQGDSYGMLSHYITFFLMLGQGDKQEKQLKLVSENELKKSFLIIQNRKIEELWLAGVVACIIFWCILRNVDPWPILVKPCSVTRGIFNGCIWVHPTWKYYHFIGISSIFVSQQVHSS